MRKIVAGALLALMAIAAAPAYAQTNTEYIIRIDDAVRDIARDMDNMLRSIDALLDDIRDVLSDVSDLTPLVEQNTESLAKIEAAILGEACGPGTQVVNGMCVADITYCDAEVVDGVCMASISCGEGTLLHLDTCIADISISYCGEGTVFRGGVCVADTAATAPAPTTGPTQTTPYTSPEPEPTIIQPVTTDRFIVDGDTIEVSVRGTDTTYTLAFSDAPGLGEAGGRAAVQYLDALCGTGRITVNAEERPTGLGTRAVIHCGGIDASQAMVVSGRASFDAEDCSVREFVDIPWTQDRCDAAEAGPAGTAPPTGTTPAPTTPTTPTAPTTPTTPTTPTEPETVEPIYGSLRYDEFTFPVTVGDVLGWSLADDGDPMTVETISCLFEHTPDMMEVVIADNSAGVYDIDDSQGQAYNDGNRRDSLIALTVPSQNILFEQKFTIGEDRYVPLTREANLISVGEYNGDYTVSMSLADWDDITWSDTTNNPPVPTDAEREQKILDIELRILTDIVNNECTLLGAPAGDTSSHEETISLAATDTTSNGVLLDIVPYDVTCREPITITSMYVFPGGNVISGFDVIHVLDNEDGNSQDDTIAASLNGPRIDGLAFRSASFTVGADDSGPDSIAQAERGSVSLSAAVLATIHYDATSSDVCTWTERSS